MPTSTQGSEPAREVSHLLSLQAQQVSDLQVPLSHLQDAPLLANQHTSADYENYIAARTGTWQRARAEGDAPGRAEPPARS